MLRCSVCGDLLNNAVQVGERCKTVRYRASFKLNDDACRCPGYYMVPQYHIFDLASSKYIPKDGSPDVVTEEWAGVFDIDELDPVLIARYGTADRFRVAFRASLILVK